MHNTYMQRCFQLARKGWRYTSKNPMVGAVLVYQDTVIGEGYHQIYGGPHAEVNCINSVLPHHRKNIKDSHLYVSLEPCSHYGKTPPCTSLIIEQGIKEVTYSNLDINPAVAGKSKTILEDHEIKVTTGILESEGRNILKKFRINHLLERSYVTLKWAQSQDFYAGKNNASVWYTNQYSKQYAHRVRAEYEAILVGTNTALLDTPSLNNRYSWGPSPDVILIDRKLKLGPNHPFYKDKTKLIIFTYTTDEDKIKQYADHIDIEILAPNENIDTIPYVLYKKYNITSLLIEGGATIQKAFIQQNLWDEAIVFNTSKIQSEGIKAPAITGSLHNELQLLDDTVYHINYKNFEI